MSDQATGYEDGALAARIVAVHALSGVRAGSALLACGQHLLAVQDDAWCVAWISLPELQLEWQILRGEGAALAKADKPDFEAALQHPDGRITLLGSGSRPNRRVVVHLHASDRRAVLQPLPALYAALQAALGPQAELNIEGAFADGQRLCVLHRGAGAARSACIELPLAALDGAECAILARRWFDLGQLDGVALHFTDAAREGGRTVFLAAAEQTADAYADGPVAGSAIGVIERRDQARWTRIIEADGQPSRRKLEGLVLDADARGAWALTDPDAGAQPAQLCRLALAGFA